MIIINCIVLLSSMLLFRRKYFSIQLLNLMAIIYFSSRVLLDGGYSQYLNGYLNIFFILPYYLLLGGIYFNNRSVVSFLVMVPLALFIFSYSSFYYNYLLGGMLVSLAIIFRLQPSATVKAAFFLVMALIVLSLQKYGLIFIIMSVFIIGIRAKSILSYIFIAIILFFIFFITINFSEYGSIAEFIDRRVTRDSYEAAQGETIFGLSDGGRYMIWAAQVSKIHGDFLFGQGLNWSFFAPTVPNHNILVSWYMTYGFIGCIILFAYLSYVLVKISDKFYLYPVIALLLLSLISEGVLLDYFAPAFAVQCALMSRLYKNRLKVRKNVKA